MTGARPSFLDLRTNAELASVRILTSLLDVGLAGLGVGAALRHDVTLAVAELATNVYEHEPGGDAAYVGVRLELSDDRLRVRVASGGPPFDLHAALAAAEARDPLESLEAGGMGLRLVRALFDEVAGSHAPERGNEISLSLRLDRAAG